MQPDELMLHYNVLTIFQNLSHNFEIWTFRILQVHIWPDHITSNFLKDVFYLVNSSISSPISTAYWERKVKHSGQRAVNNLTFQKMEKEVYFYYYSWMFCSTQYTEFLINSLCHLFYVWRKVYFAIDSYPSFFSCWLCVTLLSWQIR